MEVDKKQMLMVGPGLGHNILPWLEFLNKQTYYSITFLCSEFHFNYNDFDNIQIVEHPLRYMNMLSIRKLFEKKKFQFLYIHGANSGLNTLLLTYFVRYNVSIVNVWGESILDRANAGNFKDRLVYFILLKRINHFFFNWYGTKQKFDEYFSKYASKGKLILLGLHRDWFTELKPPTGFTKSFLQSIPRDQVICIWPKSITTGNRFDLVIQAISIIKEANPELIKSFCLYIWPGNNEEKQLRNEIDTFIVDHDLSAQVKIVKHPFLSYSDMKLILNRNNFSINFGNTDQLSSSVIEPMMLEKPLAISNIEPYILLNKEFGVKLKLVNNDVESVTGALIKLLNNTFETDKYIFSKRREIIETRYQFEKNIDLFFSTTLKHLENIEIK